MIRGKVNNAASIQVVARSIRRATDLSIGAAIEIARIAVFATPLLFPLQQSAHADRISLPVADSVLSDTIQRTGGLGDYGPFRVLDPHTVELNGETDSDTPQQFRTLLKSHPGVRLINMVECAGTVDDEANLEVARMIRRAGIDTHVPANGSVRSGGVELFLAGVRRSREPGAEFGVHSWEDEAGHQANEVSADDPINREYVTYYQEVGLAPDTAKAFYAFTNQTPFENIHYMTDDELKRFSITN